MDLSLTTAFADWSYTDLSIATASAQTSVLKVRSDGNVYSESASCVFDVNGSSLGASEHSAVGVHLSPPELENEVGGRTLYQWVFCAPHPQPSVSAHLFVGVSTGAITSGANGTFVRYLVPLSREARAGIVALPNTGSTSGSDYSTNPVCFGVRFSDLTGSGVTLSGRGSIQVQRLVGPPPRFIDRRIV